MAGVSIPVEAKFDAGDLDKMLGQLTEKINKLGQTVGTLNDVKFNPIGKATLDDLQKVQTQFGSLMKISEAFRKRMQQSGQSGTGFFDVDWSKMYDDPAQRARQMDRAYKYVTAGTGASFTSTASPHPAPGPMPGSRGVPGSGGGSGGGGYRPPSPPTPGTTWGGAGRNIISSGLRAAGPVGEAADGAIGGLAGGLASALPMFLGTLAALGVGKLVSGVVGKVGDA